MFSLYLTKMNIHIDNFDMREISVELLNRMVYLHSYLENDWTIKKRDGCYIMTKESNKIIISDSCDYSKLKINKELKDLLFSSNRHYMHLFDILTLDIDLE